MFLRGKPFHFYFGAMHMTIYCFSVVYMLNMLSKKLFVPPYCRTKCENLEDTFKMWRGSCFVARNFLLRPEKSVQIKAQFLFAYADNRNTCCLYWDQQKTTSPPISPPSVADWLKRLWTLQLFNPVYVLEIRSSYGLLLTAKQVYYRKPSCGLS